MSERLTEVIAMRFSPGELRVVAEAARIEGVPLRTWLRIAAVRGSGLRVAGTPDGAEPIDDALGKLRRAADELTAEVERLGFRAARSA